MSKRIKTPGKLGKGPIAIGESEQWPVHAVRTAQYYSEGLEDGADEKAIAKYKKLLLAGKCPPIAVSDRYSPNDPLDGSHRVIAAHRAGLDTLPAHVEPGTVLIN